MPTTTDPIGTVWDELDEPSRTYWRGEAAEALAAMSAPQLAAGPAHTISNPPTAPKE